jgi:hypothetical protein
VSAEARASAQQGHAVSPELQSLVQTDFKLVAQKVSNLSLIFEEGTADEKQSKLTEIYVNGEKYSQERFRQDFGSTLSFV